LANRAARAAGPEGNYPFTVMATPAQLRFMLGWSWKQVERWCSTQKWSKSFHYVGSEYVTLNGEGDSLKFEVTPRRVEKS
jgi:hypothetical protein